MELPHNFRKPSQKLTFTTFRNSYEFHSQNYYILRKNFINNYYIQNLSNSFDRSKLPEHIHMNVGKYGVVALIRMASLPFDVFQEND